MDNFNDSIFPEKTITYASFWARVGAYILDALILLIPNLIVSYGCKAMFGTVGGALIGNLITIVINVLYFGIQESGLNQATIGKKALGLKVTNLYGDRISMGQAIGRYFGKILSALIIFIGFLMMLWDDKSQCLHDKMAGTLVIKEY